LEFGYSLGSLFLNLFNKIGFDVILCNFLLHFLFELFGLFDKIALFFLTSSFLNFFD